MIDRLKVALYVYNPRYFATQNPYAQHDSAEGIQALCNVVAPEIGNAISLAGHQPLTTILTDVFAIDNVWVNMVIQLRWLIEPYSPNERDIGDEQKRAAFEALDEARLGFVDELTQIAENRQAGETVEHFQKREAIVAAVRNFFGQLQLHGYSLKLRPFIEAMERAVLAQHPNASFTKGTYDQLVKLVVDAFLPENHRNRLLNEQIRLATQKLKRQLDDYEITQYSLQYGLTINNNFQYREEPPPFICLIRTPPIDRANMQTFTVDNQEKLPMQINLADVTLEGTKATYELVGTTFHIGFSTLKGYLQLSGHYIAELFLGGRQIVANDAYINDLGNTPFCFQYGAIVYRRIS